jgi:GMP synthase (glutamine-hydrolysing)
MKIQCITHADFETPGVIETWAKDKGHQFSIYAPYKEKNYKLNDDFDFLIVMGGPQSPLEIDEAPYLKDEISTIKKAINQNKIVLGFCLGAQLIGEALGATTEKSPNKEIGVFPITLTKQGLQDPIFANFPKSFPVIHWHNDMPGETKTSTLLAYSEGCPKQIIRYSSRVYGFQCHMEITKEGIQTMIKACPNDLKPSKYTQTPNELIKQNYNEINNYMITILDHLVASSRSNLNAA